MLDKGKHDEDLTILNSKTMAKQAGSLIEDDLNYAHKRVDLKANGSPPDLNNLS